MKLSNHIAAPTEINILVIDDEDYVADMIATLLELEGYHVTVAYNGRDGLRLAQQRTNDLIIVDIMMPFINGIDLVKQLYIDPAHQHIPIILISAGARPQEPLEQVTFVAKPFHAQDLIHLIQNLLIKS